jgi:hypothetical protein
VIARGYDGWRPGGLVVYLFGAGRFEEHKRPRVVAAHNGAPGSLQPPKSGAGEFDFDLRALIAHMQHGVRLAGLPLDNPPAITAEWIEHLRSGKKIPAEAPDWLRFYRYDRSKDAVVLRDGYVWHTPVRLAPQDRTLTDAQWDHIAQRIMSRVGIHDAGCRWVAVRHADDHVHLMAVLVREAKPGVWKRYHPKFWKTKLREACQELEVEFGLTLTADSDWTAAVQPSKAELEKAGRAGIEPPRLQLRRLVSQTAATVRTVEEFGRVLEEAGVRARWKSSSDGTIVGYAVALPGDTTAAGAPVWFAGGELAPDLTMPKLLARWASTPVPALVEHTDDGRVTPDGRREVLAEAEQIVTRAAQELRNGKADGDSVAHGTGELLTALARVAEGQEGGKLTAVADAFDRASRTPWRVLPNQMAQVSADLRRAARRLGMIGSLSRRGHEQVAMAILVLAVGSLIAEIAAFKEDRGRLHQAMAARRAAAALPTQGRLRSDRRPPTQPVAGGSRTRPDVRTSPLPGEARPKRRGPG